jgi:hypothetical protein
MKIGETSATLNGTGGGIRSNAYNFYDIISSTSMIRFANEFVDYY